MPPTIVPIGDSLIYAETAPMTIPQTGGKTRHVEFRLPLFHSKPTVVATIHSDRSPGAAFTVSSIKINEVDGQTQIVILASNVEKGVAVPYKYFCNLVVVGQAAKAKPARRKRAAE
jgi:hypothetical protein